MHSKLFVVKFLIVAVALMLGVVAFGQSTAPNPWAAEATEEEAILGLSGARQQLDAARKQLDASEAQFKGRVERFIGAVKKRLARDGVAITASDTLAWRQDDRGALVFYVAPVESSR